MELLQALENLRLRLESSGVARTVGLYKSMGTDCAYYKKSLDLFERKDFDDLKKLLNEVNKQLSLVEKGG